MAATTTLIPAPPVLAPSRVGRLFSTFHPQPFSDPHYGMGVIYERDVQVNGTALWGGNPCETPGSSKAATEIMSTVGSVVYTIFQMAKCRMLNEWDSLDGRMGVLFEAGEERTVETAFAASLIAGAFGASAAGPTATDAGPRAALAVAEQYIRTQMTSGVILASPEVVTYEISRAIVERDGDLLYTHLGTPVVALPGLGDDLYVTGQISIWEGVRTDPRTQRGQVSPYANEFVVLTERVYAIAVEGDASGSMPIVKWTVNMTIDP